ncbi:hypothetical protein [Ancylobacter vacuolatus]|uniref:hypothetical protein n=1 Tax=Ancylobacter vacuolatus TaxID=223389 RepID=UPI003635289E
MSFDAKQTQHVAKCPACGAPHHYVEVKFPIENDRGGWEVSCHKCGKPFTISLRNPEESLGRNFKILKRFDDEIGGYQGSAPPAIEVVEHSLDMNDHRLRYDYTRSPIYRCTQSGIDLEKAALGQLESHLSAVHSQFYNARNYILASKVPELENVVVTVPVQCRCGSPHNAIFYFRLFLNETPAPSASEMLLANVDGASLEDELTGIHSKSLMMDALQKLIARWRLKFDQIVIASPFIAHQYMSKEKKLEVWEWLLGILDPQRTLFITRSNSYKDYKTALLDSGLDHDMLASFGLESRIIGAGTKKQDFHAKVYIGVGETCEILSGSANLVPGKSMENASFSTMDRG